jgi:hypothetical protein
LSGVAVKEQHGRKGFDVLCFGEPQVSRVSEQKQNPLI